MSDTQSVEDKVGTLFGIEDANTGTTEDTNTDTAIESDDEAVDTSVDATKEQAEEVKQEPQKGRLPANETGDLIDPATGAIIAKAGNERRYFERWRNDNTRLQATQRDLETANAHLSALREAAQLPTKLALEPNEVDTALNFMASYKRDPVGAAKELLTHVRSLGHNIDDLAPTIDMAAMQLMIDAKLAPLTNASAQAAREAEVKSQVDREVAEVEGRHPWLLQQQTELMTLMEADPTLSLREAALTLKEFALSRGYDLNQSLRQQHLTGVKPTSASQHVNRAASPTRPLATNASTRRTSVSDELSSKDIIASVLREHNINVE